MSESVCLFGCSLTPKNGEHQLAKILRDDFRWDAECFRLKKIRIRLTVSWKMACILATKAVNFILSSMNLQRIWEVGRGWGD